LFELVSSAWIASVAISFFDLFVEELEVGIGILFSKGRDVSAKNAVGLKGCQLNTFQLSLTFSFTHHLLCQVQVV